MRSKFLQDIIDETPFCVDYKVMKWAEKLKQNNMKTHPIKGMEKEIKIIYISGKISGIENEAPKLFNDAENLLKEQGFEVVNPMTINHEHDKSWLSYMKEDVKAMMDCDSIYMLNNWKQSKGAKVERDIARQLGFTILYQK